MRRVADEQATRGVQPRALGALAWRVYVGEMVVCTCCRAPASQMCEHLAGRLCPDLGGPLLCHHATPLKHLNTCTKHNIHTAHLRGWGAARPPARQSAGSSPLAPCYAVDTLPCKQFEHTCNRFLNPCTCGAGALAGGLDRNLRDPAFWRPATLLTHSNT